MWTIFNISYNYFCLIYYLIDRYLLINCNLLIKLLIFIIIWKKFHVLNILAKFTQTIYLLNFIFIIIWSKIILHIFYLFTILYLVENLLYLLNVDLWKFIYRITHNTISIKFHLHLQIFFNISSSSDISERNIFYLFLL